MSLIWPGMLLSLLVVPVLVLLYVRREQVRRRWATTRWHTKWRSGPPGL